MPEYDPFASKRGPRVSVQANFPYDGVDIYMAIDHGQIMSMMLFESGPHPILKVYEPMTAVERPTMTLNSELAMELCRALMHHFKLASLSSDREDLLEERKRSDKLINALVDNQASLIEGIREGL